MDKKGRFMNLIIIGAPGSGKGTQAAKICSEFNIAHISTGNMLREAIAKGTPEGKLAKEIIDKGNLVDDEVIFKMLNRRVSEDDCANGFLLDGVPRNKSQIEFVEKLGIDKVIFIDIKFNDIRKSHLQNVVDSSGKNYPTLRKLKILLSQIYTFAMENDICGKWRQSQFEGYISEREHHQRCTAHHYGVFLYLASSILCTGKRICQHHGQHI